MVGIVICVYTNTGIKHLSASVKFMKYLYATGGSHLGNCPDDSFFVLLVGHFF